MLCNHILVTKIVRSTAVLSQYLKGMSEELLVTDKERLNKVKSILVSQPEPSDKNSPYHKLADKYNLKIDFRH